MGRRYEVFYGIGGSVCYVKDMWNNRRVSPLYINYRSAMKRAIDMELRQIKTAGIKLGKGVLSFLRKNPDLIELILEAKKELDYYLNPAHYTLELSEHEIDLYLFAHVTMDPTQAKKQLNRFDNEWWIENMWRAKGKLFFDVQYV